MTFLKDSHHFRRTLGNVWRQSLKTVITSAELWAMFEDSLQRQSSLQQNFGQCLMTDLLNDIINTCRLEPSLHYWRANCPGHLLLDDLCRYLLLDDSLTIPITWRYLLLHDSLYFSKSFTWRYLLLDETYYLSKLLTWRHLLLDDAYHLAIPIADEFSRITSWLTACLKVGDRKQLDQLRSWWNRVTSETTFKQ